MTDQHLAPVCPHCRGLEHEAYRRGMDECSDCVECQDHVGKLHGDVWLWRRRARKWKRRAREADGMCDAMQAERDRDRRVHEQDVAAHVRAVNKARAELAAMTERARGMREALLDLALPCEWIDFRVLARKAAGEPIP